MTRVEYPVPTHLSGDRLAEELTAAGVQTDPLGVSITGSRLVLVWDRALTTAEFTTAEDVVGRHSWTPAKEAVRRRAVVKDRVQALSMDDPQAVLSRATLRVAYLEDQETRRAIRDLIGWANSRGARIEPLQPDRTWEQVLAAGRQIAASETDPES